MELSTAEKIRIILKRQGMTVAELAKLTGQARQNLSQKLKRNSFSVEDLTLYAEKMGVKYESTFILDNGDKL